MPRGLYFIGDEACINCYDNSCRSHLVYNLQVSYVCQIMSICIALVTGGYIEEAAVSLKSVNFVFQQLDKSTYKVYTITITTDSWFHVDEHGVKYPVDRDDFSLSMDERTIRFDLAFIMLHGSPGEDGRLQGYFDMVGL